MRPWVIKRELTDRERFVILHLARICNMVISDTMWDYTDPDYPWLTWTGIVLTECKGTDGRGLLTYEDGVKILSKMIEDESEEVGT